MDSSELISWRIPTYRISDREMREIFEPMNSVMAADDDAERESEADGGGEKGKRRFSDSCRFSAWSPKP